MSKGERIVDLGAGPTLALTALAWSTLDFESALAMQGTSIGYQMRIGAPLSILHYLGAASRSGVLVKDGRSLELLAHVDTVLFDRTGALTADIPTLQRIIVTGDIPVNQTIIDELDDDSYATQVYVAVDGKLAGILQLIPTLRPEAQTLIETLHARGLDMYIVSGDLQTPTQRLADTLGIESCYAEMFPHEKAELVKKLQEQGRSVCFVGDGINDSIALMQANVSISMHGASAIAIDSASAVLMKPDLNLIAELFNLAEEMGTNLNRGVFLTIAPGVTCAFSVLFLGLGITGALLLYNGTFLLSLGNGLLPYLKSRLNSPPDKEAANIAYKPM